MQHHRLTVPRTRLKTQGDRAFTHATGFVERSSSGKKKSLSVFTIQNEPEVTSFQADILNCANISVYFEATFYI